MRRFILFAGDRDTTPNDFPRKLALKMHDSETDNEFSVQPLVGPRFVLFTSFTQEQKASIVPLLAEILQSVWKMNISRGLRNFFIRNENCHSQFSNEKQEHNCTEQYFSRYIRKLV